MKRDGTIVRAETTTGEEVRQRQAQPFTMLIPVLQRFALRMRAIASAELDSAQQQVIQIARGLPISTALAFCPSVQGDDEPYEIASDPFVAVISLTTCPDHVRSFNPIRHSPENSTSSYGSRVCKVKFKKALCPMERALLYDCAMQGFITDRDFDLVELIFPGIRRFYLETQPKPVTFLELLWLWEDRPRRVQESPLGGDSPRRRARL